MRKILINQTYDLSVEVEVSDEVFDSLSSEDQKTRNKAESSLCEIADKFGNELEKVARKSKLFKKNGVKLEWANSSFFDEENEELFDVG